MLSMYFKKTLKLISLFILFAAFIAPDNAKSIKVFIGYDERESVAAPVCLHSIRMHTQEPLELQLLGEKDVTVGWDSKQMSAFGRSRFLTPSRSHFTGWSLFMDGDMILREDIARLWALRDERCAVMVVQHPDFNATHELLGRATTTYNRFNWSSVMLFNNARCTALTPEYVNNAPYTDLHQFRWLSASDEIGNLPPEWNHLVGYYDHNPNAALIHWTLGGPYLGKKYQDSDYVEDWYDAAAMMMGVSQDVVKGIYSAKE